MTRIIKLLCSDRGQHASAELDLVQVKDDGTFDLVRTRMVPAPWSRLPGARISADGASNMAPKRVAAEKASRRADYEGRRRWRLPCARCGRDIKLNESTMQNI